MNIDALIVEIKTNTCIHQKNARNAIFKRKEVRELKDKRERLEEEETDLDGKISILQTKIADANQKLLSLNERKHDESPVVYEVNHNQKMNKKELIKKLEIAIEKKAELKAQKDDQIVKLKDLENSKKVRKISLNDISKETQKMNVIFELFMKNNGKRAEQS